MGLLTNLLEFYKKNKKNIFYVLLFVVIFFHGTDLSFAGGGGGGGGGGTVGVNTPPEKSKLENTVINFVNGVLGIFSMVIGFITLIVGLFLRPEWTSGSVIGLDTQLKTMWILISNFVYFIFAGIFIFIAFMNIVGDADHYGLKKAIPKFIVGVLIVPFSWFFVQLILSLSGVLTAAVLSLPYDTFPTLDIQKKELNLCKDGTELNLSKTGSSMFSCKGGSDKVPTKIGDFIKSNDNGGLYQIMVIYSYGVMRLDEKGKVSGKDIGEKGGINSLTGLSLQFIFDIIFIVVYGLLLVALFLAFITRGFALWLYAMFSPFFGLLYYLGKAGEGIGEGALKNFNLKEFIGLAMVPVYVAGALSFGLLFLYVAGQGFSGSDKTGLVKMDQDSLVIGSGSSTTTLKANAIKSSANNLSSSNIFAGFGGPIGAMFLEMLGLAILWMAVMAALHQSKITDSVAHPIAEFGKQIGDLIKKAPGYAPILPGGLSAEGLKTIGGQANNYFQSQATSKGQQWLKDRNLFQNEEVDRENKLNELIRKVNANPGDLASQKALADAIRSNKDYVDFSDSKASREGLILLGKQLGVEDAKLKAGSQAEVETLIKAINEKDSTGRLGVRNVNTAKDFFTGSSSHSGDSKDGSSSNPLGIKETDKDKDGTYKMKIDSDTTIYMKDGKFVNNSDKSDLLKHLVNDKTVGTMSKQDVEKWLKDTIGLKDKNLTDFMKDLEGEVSKLSKKDDFWQKKSDDKKS